MCVICITHAQARNKNTNIVISNHDLDMIYQCENHTKCGKRFIDI